MKIREKAIHEIENLDVNNLMIIYELMLSMKKRDKIQAPRSVEISSCMKVRELLKNIKGSLSDDIILDRENRI